MAAIKKELHEGLRRLVGGDSGTFTMGEAGLEKVWREGLHGLVGSSLSPFVGDYPFGTVLRPRNDNGMRIMAVGDGNAMTLCPEATEGHVMAGPGEIGPYGPWNWEPVQKD